MQRIANPSTSVRLRDAPPNLAQVVKSVDTRDLKSLGLKAVRVQVPPWAPYKNSLIKQWVSFKKATFLGGFFFGFYCMKNLNWQQIGSTLALLVFYPIALNRLLFFSKTYLFSRLEKYFLA